MKNSPNKASAATDEPTGKAEVLERRILHEASFLRLVAEDVRLPNGQATTLEMFEHPGAAAVVPCNARGEVVLLRQYRHAVGGWLWEIPAGKLDEGEEPRACAERELVEETGYSAARWSELGPIVSSPGFTDEIIHLFLAQDLTAGQGAPDEDELFTVVNVPIERALEMARDGSITDAKTVCALLRAAPHVESA